MNKRISKINGFTLLEILIVIAILSIMLSIFTWYAVRTVRMNEVRDAAEQIAADIRAARSSAPRTLQDATVTLTTSMQYTVAISGTTRTRTISQRNIQLSSVSGDSTVTYTAPYGEVANAAGDIWRVGSTVTGIPPFFVKIIGALGEVVVSAQN